MSDYIPIYIDCSREHNPGCLCARCSIVRTIEQHKEMAECLRGLLSGPDPSSARALIKRSKAVLAKADAENKAAAERRHQ